MTGISRIEISKKPTREFYAKQYSDALAVWRGLREFEQSRARAEALFGEIEATGWALAFCERQDRYIERQCPDAGARLTFARSLAEQLVADEADAVCLSRANWREVVRLKGF